MPSAWFERYEDIYITLRREILTQHGTKHGKFSDSPALAE